MVEVYKWGGIAFDNYSISKTLILPSDADTVEITFHDEVGADYQVPVDKAFIAGKLCWGGVIGAADVEMMIGESAAAEGALTKTLIGFVLCKNNLVGGYYFGTFDLVAVFATGKYVTAATTEAAKDMLAGTTLYGIEIDV